jgi:hypothetical protein
VLYDEEIKLVKKRIAKNEQIYPNSTTLNDKLHKLLI